MSSKVFKGWRGWVAALGIALPLAAQAEEARIAVSELKVAGNTLLPQSKLDAVLLRFRGERSMEELQQAAKEVQKLYRDAGYGAVIAYLPEQSAAAGRITIVVLEGRLAQIDVVGNRQFSTENIRRSLPLLAEGQPLPVRRIDAQIQLANENPAKQVAVTLEPGKKRGEVDARVLVTEQPVSRWIFNVDNTGNEQTGRWRTGLVYQHAALWQRDHQLMLQGITSPDEPEAVKIVAGSYRIPFYGWSSALDLYGAYSSVDGGTTATPVGALQFSGRGRAWGMRLTRLLPHRGELGQRVALALDRRDYLSYCAIEGLPPGACGTAGESVTVHPLALEYVAQHGGRLPAGAHLALVRGLDLGGRYGDQANFDAVRPGAPQGYTALRVNTFATLALPQGWRLQGRVNGQASSDALVPGEQFGLAGANAVRGYEEREITGDRGVLSSFELSTPELAPPSLATPRSVRLLAFGDAGKVWNRLGTQCRAGHSDCTLASVGLGARAGLGSLLLRLDVAYTLEPGTRTERSDTKAHFQASYGF